MVYIWRYIQRIPECGYWKKESDVWNKDNSRWIFYKMKIINIKEILGKNCYNIHSKKTAKKQLLHLEKTKTQIKWSLFFLKFLKPCKKNNIKFHWPNSTYLIITRAQEVIWYWTHMIQKQNHLFLTFMNWGLQKHYRC